MKIEYQNKIIIGSDETGVGDYFTPLVAAAVRVTPGQTTWLKALGVRDSKALSSSQITRIATELKSKVDYSVQYMSQAQYNFLTSNEKLNANELKAILHLKAINYLESKFTDNDLIIIDQFAADHNFKKYIANLRRTQEISDLKAPYLLITNGEQEHLAVAAASILARAHLLKKMHEQNEAWSFKFPLGVSAGVIASGKEFVATHGEKALYKVAKLSFRTTEQIVK